MSVEMESIRLSRNFTHTGVKDKYYNYFKFPLIFFNFCFFSPASTFLSLFTAVLKKKQKTNIWLSAHITNPKVSLPWGCNLSTWKWGPAPARVSTVPAPPQHPKQHRCRRGDVKWRWTRLSRLSFAMERGGGGSWKGGMIPQPFLKTDNDSNLRRASHTKQPPWWLARPPRCCPGGTAAWLEGRPTPQRVSHAQCLLSKRLASRKAANG